MACAAADIDSIYFKGDVRMERKLKVRITPMVLSILMMLSLILSMPPMQALAVDYNFIFPVNNGVKIAYYYGYTASYGGDHTGLDIHDKTGDDTIYAAYSGVVQATANSCPHVDYGAACEHYNTFGNYIRIKGNNGLYFYYGHLKKDSLLVSVGDTVVAGQPIAKMGSSGFSTGKHLHFEVRTSTSSSSKINVNPTSKGGLITYSNGPYIGVTPVNYSLITGTFYMKNKSTSTYLNIPGSDTNGSAMGLAAKKETDAFKMVISPITSGNANNGHYIRPKSCTRVVNPYANSPTNGTKVTLYDKTTDGQQYWLFEKSGDGYILHIKWNPNLVLTGSGTSVTVATKSGAANQIWTLEDATAVPATLSSIAIDADSVGTIYEDGGQMDTSGLTLTATYSDKTTKKITSGYSLTRPSLATAGTKTLTVTYEGKTATLDITVQDLFEGNGAASDPYLITTDEDLKNLANMVNNTAANPCYGTAYYKQTADIDLSLYDWTPIGIYFESVNSTTYSSNAVFKGHYDGNYHKVNNLKVNYKNYYAGLFGRLNYTADGAVVENLSVNGSVKGSKDCTGGIVGEAGYGAVIRNCDFTGTVNGVTLVGAIAGKVHNGGTIQSCYANAQVTATDGYAGGITGTVLAANAGHSTDALIENCYFTGKLSGTTVGGIAGASELGTKNETTITFTNNYYLNSAASGAVAGAAQTGCLGLISSQLKTVAADLGDPFVDNPYAAINDGYPVFEWQLVIAGDVNTDGTVSVLDVVTLQKYLLTTGSLNADQCRNADMCNDDVVDAYDLAILKRVLLSK